MAQAEMAISSWTVEDDNLLVSLKERKGLGWKQIAAHFEGRTPNACQFRWRRLKSGTLKSRRKVWSAEEDKLLMTTSLSVGEIAMLLPQKGVGEIIERRKRLSTRSKLSISSLLNNAVVLPPLAPRVSTAAAQSQRLPPVSSIL